MRRIVRRLRHNAHLPLGHQPRPRASSCPAQDMARLETAETVEAAPVTMRDKIVEARPR